jgi:hypothetical protein
MTKSAMLFAHAPGPSDTINMSGKCPDVISRVYLSLLKTHLFFCHRETGHKAPIGVVGKHAIGIHVQPFNSGRMMKGNAEVLFRPPVAGIGIAGKDCLLCVPLRQAQSSRSPNMGHSRPLSFSIDLHLAPFIYARPSGAAKSATTHHGQQGYYHSFRHPPHHRLTSPAKDLERLITTKKWFPNGVGVAHFPG